MLPAKQACSQPECPGGGANFRNPGSVSGAKLSTGAKICGQGGRTDARGSYSPLAPAWLRGCRQGYLSRVVSQLRVTRDNSTCDYEKCRFIQFYMILEKVLTVNN